MARLGNTLHPSPASCGPGVRVRLGGHGRHAQRPRRAEGAPLAAAERIRVASQGVGGGGAGGAAEAPGVRPGHLRPEVRGGPRPAGGAAAPSRRPAAHSAGAPLRSPEPPGPGPARASAQTSLPDRGRRPLRPPVCSPSAPARPPAPAPRRTSPASERTAPAPGASGRPDPAAPPPARSAPCSPGTGRAVSAEDGRPGGAEGRRGAPRAAPGAGGRGNPRRRLQPGPAAPRALPGHRRLLLRVRGAGARPRQHALVSVLAAPRARRPPPQPRPPAGRRRLSGLSTPAVPRGRFKCLRCARRGRGGKARRAGGRAPVPGPRSPGLPGGARGGREPGRAGRFPGSQPGVCGESRPRPPSQTQLNSLLAK